MIEKNKNKKPVFCNICSRSCAIILSNERTFNEETGNYDDPIWDNEMAIITASFGYGSNHDGEMYRAHICEECFFEKIRPLFAINPYNGNYMFPEKDYEGFEDPNKKDEDEEFAINLFGKALRTVLVEVYNKYNDINVRVVHPKQPITAEFNSERLNIILNDQEIVEKAYWG